MIRMVERMIEHLRNIKIPQRLMISYMLISVLPIVFIGVFTSHIARQAILERMNVYSKQISKCISNDVERYQNELLEISNSISYSEYMQEALKEYVQSEGSLQVSNNIIDYIRSNVTNSSVSDIRIVMDTGDVINCKMVYRLQSSEMDRLKQSVQDADGLPVFVSTELESGNEGVTLARGIYSSDSLEKIGEIYITVTETGIREIYEEIDFGKDSVISIVDSMGNIISTNNENEKIDLGELTQAIYSEDAGQSGVVTFEVSGQKQYIAFDKIGDENWCTVCMVPYSYLDSVVNQIRFYIYICAAVCVFICLLFTMIINTSISKPLIKLRNHMRDANENTLPDKIEDVNRDEIADVTNSFNYMIDEIQTLVEEIHVSEQQKVTEKLKALQAQINPHFLSNTLNTIKWMASMQNATNIEELVTSLINLLQVSMGKVDDLVPIEKEIEYVRNYVEIQSFRYLDKFDVQYDIHEEVQKCKLPPFTIQPIVENAIVHGIDPKRGKGNIWISAYRIDDSVICEVKDNGVGFSEEQLESKKKARGVSGLGMRSVDERIKMMFGKNYGVSYESISGIYTKVMIEIPYDKELEEKINET